MDDIDRTFDRLKRSDYRTLQQELLNKYGRLFEVDTEENVYWPMGSEEIIKSHGWTVKELFDKALEKYDEKQSGFY